MLHFGIRDQNLELKIGISDEKIYLVTTLSIDRLSPNLPASIKRRLSSYSTSHANLFPEWQARDNKSMVDEKVIANVKV